MVNSKTKIKVWLKLSVIISLVFMAACQEKSQQSKQSPPPPPAVAGNTLDMTWTFDGITPGNLPPGWQVTATRQKGPLASWQVISDTSALSGEQVLALTSTNHSSGGTFNICWLDSGIFLDGEINVYLKAISGTEDQGGGVIWRAQDKDNYYIARFNPLEDNFRLYYVQNGSRRKLADAHIHLPTGQWQALKIIQQGTQFQAFLNGNLLMEGVDDHFKQAGKVGLWTKADAVTSFDNLTIHSRSDK